MPSKDDVERVIQAEIVEELKSGEQPRLVFKLTTYGFYGASGWPDLLVLEPGAVAWFIEVKTSTGKVSRRQTLMHRRIRALGFDVYVIRNLEALKRTLRSRASS